MVNYDNKKKTKDAIDSMQITPPKCPDSIAKRKAVGEITPIESVDVTASGYEFNCPHCQILVKLIESTETVQCPECTRVFANNGPEHALA